MTTIDLTATRLDFSMTAGDDFSVPYKFAGDLSARTFAATLQHGSDEPVEFTVEAIFDADEVRSINGVEYTGITTVTQSLTGDVTAGLPSVSRWDLQMTTDDTTRTLFGGSFVVEPQVTA